MTNLKIINHNGIFTVDSREVAEMVDRDLKLLNNICSRSFLESNKLALLDEVKEASGATRHAFPFLMHAVDSLIIDNFFKTLPTEMDMQASFRARINEFLPEAEIIEKKSRSKHIPDLWVMIDKEEIPVEMKLKGFNIKALEQLQRYMFFYKCKRGIAVAQTLDCEIPGNITFIKFDLSTI